MKRHHHRFEFSDWLAIAWLAGVLAVAFSPTVAGTAFRAAISVWLGWAGWIDYAAYEAFVLRFHW